MNTVEATFGFVDLAGFTALTEAHGDAEAIAQLDRFRSITLGAIGPEDRLVKTIGDAAMLVFPEPGPAVHAIGRLLAALSSSGMPSGRAGLHHGTAITRDEDYFGASVNLTARVAERAHGGQLLATTGVADAARGLGVAVVDLGCFALRNVAEPVELFELEVFPAGAGTTVDPVCRMQVARADAAGRLRHGGRDYWFCSLRCAGAFAADPGRILGPPT